MGIGFPCEDARLRRRVFTSWIYPTNEEYESNVTPDKGSGQLVWPKTTSVTAAAVAALSAQCATSAPLFARKTYPATAAFGMYLSQKAQLGWNFLTNAVSHYGLTFQNGILAASDAYQKITSYGDDFADSDELCWAACQMYLATGDQTAHQMLMSWLTPTNPACWRWGWQHMSESYGNCIRSYAFAVQSGRVAASALNPAFLAQCQSEVLAAGNDALSWSDESAYGTSFPSATKSVQSAGWYFSADQTAFDLAVAYQLTNNPAYLNGIIANMNYEAGCNPISTSVMTPALASNVRAILSVNGS